MIFCGEHGEETPAEFLACLKGASARASGSDDEDDE